MSSISRGKPGVATSFFRCRGLRKRRSRIQSGSIRPPDCRGDRNDPRGPDRGGGDGRIHVIWNGAMKAKGDRPPLFYARSKSRWNRIRGATTCFGKLADGWRWSRCCRGWSRRSLRLFPRRRGPRRGGQKGFCPDFDQPRGDLRKRTGHLPEGLGVCACCGMQAFADAKGRLFVIYRTASEGGRMRDIATLFSKDGGRT